MPDCVNMAKTTAKPIAKTAASQELPKRNDGIHPPIVEVESEGIVGEPLRLGKHCSLNEGDRNSKPKRAPASKASALGLISFCADHEVCRSLRTAFKALSVCYPR